MLVHIGVQTYKLHDQWTCLWVNFLEKLQRNVLHRSNEASYMSYVIPRMPWVFQGDLTVLGD